MSDWFMYLFFFGIGLGSTNSVAAGYNVPSRLREFSARLGAFPPYPHPHPHTLGFEVLPYQTLSDSNWLPGVAEDALFPGMCAM